MRKSTYLSERAWESVDSQVRKAILHVYRVHAMGGRRDIIGKFASDVADKLSLVGEGLLARRFLRPDDLDAEWDGSEWVIKSKELIE